MLDNPLDLFADESLNGQIVEISFSLYWYLRQQARNLDSEQNSFLFSLAEDEALIVWKDISASKSCHYARLFYAPIYSRRCKGSLFVTSIKAPRPYASAEFPFRILGTEGKLEGLEFLSRYCFANIDPIRNFVRYYETITRPVHQFGWRGDFMLQTRPELFCDAELGKSRPSSTTITIEHALPY